MKGFYMSVGVGDIKLQLTYRNVLIENDKESLLVRDSLKYKGVKLWM